MKIEPIVFKTFEIRLLETPEELEIVQKLRYQEMVLEYNKDKINVTGLDESPYDEYCDHIIAIDLEKNEIVGTYRLIQDAHINFIGSFITEEEFNIDSLKNSSHKLLELGRAVVKKKYRGGIIIKLIWKFLLKYVQHHNIRFLFGTASYHGHDPKPYLQSFAYLHQQYLIPNLYHVFPQPAHAVSMTQISQDEIDKAEALHQTPPLIKGYLAMGARVGDGAYIDYDFNSVDVFVVLDMTSINHSYLNRIFK